jgi:hypothetical protein
MTQKYAISSDTILHNQTLQEQKPVILKYA